MFVDQSYWQAAISSKPGHGVWGFITAGIAWFAIPFATAFTFGMGYWVYSIQMDAPIATNEEMREGEQEPNKLYTVREDTAYLDSRP